LKHLILSTLLFFSQVTLGASEPDVLPGIAIKGSQLDAWHQVYKKRSQEIDELRDWENNREQAFYINSLINTSSPYLLRHAFNPVAWYQWNDETLKRAEKENKLIFLSIGYSSCHWCHVMERESFMDTEVAEVLNRHYISVKVDKEVSPQLDHRYTLALELSQGSSGWPVSAVLTPSGDVVFIDAYIGKDKLIELTTRLAANWKSKQSFFEQSAKFFMREVDNLMSLSGELQSIDNDSLNKAYQKIESRFDTGNGGITGDVKFPEPALYQLLLDNIQRESDKKLEGFVKLSLDNLYQNNLYDHLYGGFFRYSTNADYSVPHFEKMLYTQAHMVKVYARAYRVFDEPQYLEVAKDTLRFVDEWLGSENGMYFSAIDADYNHQEGGYYLWSESEKNRASENLKEKVGWDKLAENFLPSYPIPESARKSLQRYNSSHGKKVKPFIDKKVITSWNAYLVDALVEMYAATNDRVYLDKGQKLAETLWQNSWDSEQGNVSRILYYGERQAANSIEDSIHLGLAFLKLHKYTLESDYLEKSKKLFASLEKHHLQHDSGVDGKTYTRGSVSNLIANDSEGFSTLGEFTKFISYLRKAEESVSLRYKNNQLFQAISTRFIGNPYARLSLFSLLNNHLNGSIQKRQFFANGNGFAELSQVDRANSYKLNIQLKEHWHVNSISPSKKELIATSVELLADGKLVDADITYPKPLIKSLSFANQPLSLYEGTFEIDIVTTSHKGSSYLLKLNTQACSDNVCLFPETLAFPLK